MRWEGGTDLPSRYWRPGFVPLTELGTWGYTVVDTKGQLADVEGQVLSFDWKDAGPLRVEYEDVAKWIETNLRSMERGGLADPARHQQVRIELNWEYASRYRADEWDPSWT